MLESIFYAQEAVISTQDCLISIGVAILLGLAISAIYKITTQKATKNFLITLSVLPLLAQIVILLVNGNLGTSLAVAGAFGFIRFRSLQGTSKEIITLFWAMATGLALGMGYILFAAIVTVIISIIMIMSSKVLSKMEDRSRRRLKVVIPENLDYSEIFDDLFYKFTDKVELQKVKTTNMGSTFELTYMVSLKKDANEKEFLDQIRVRNANMLVMLEREEVSEVEL